MEKKQPTKQITSSIPAPIDQTTPQMIFVTEGSHASLLQWHFNGQEYIAWSTTDFNLPGGVIEYMKDGKKHTTFIMAEPASQLERFDLETPAEVSDFQLTKGNPDSMAALDVVRDVVTLCDTECAYFIEKATQSTKVKKQPQQDITVNFWKVEKEVAR